MIIGHVTGNFLFGMDWVIASGPDRFLGWCPFIPATAELLSLLLLSTGFA